MNNTGFAELLDKNKNIALPHALLDGKTAQIDWDRSIAFAAAGGVFSTAEDMARWLLLHLNEGTVDGVKVLSPETVKEMHAPSMVNHVSFTDLPPINENSGLTYGLGWDNFFYQGKTIVEKTGALDGTRSLVTLIPEQKTGIVVLANLNLTVFPELVRAKFLESLLGKEERNLEEEFKQAQAMVDKVIAIPDKPKNVVPLSQPLKAYAGTFSNPLYGNVKIEQQDGKLTFAPGKGDYIGTLSHWSSDTFLLTWPSIDAGNQFATFTFGPEGKAASVQTETLGTFKLQE